MIFGMAVVVGKCGPRIVLPGFKVTSCLTVVLLICLETVLLCTESNCFKSFNVHWNTTNSIFRIDNTDHIIDVNKGNVQFEYDQVNIICPVYMPGTYDEDAEKYIIYNVSKEEYETCRITNPNPKIIAICDKPNKLMYFTITFRPFTPQPGGLEFLPGNDYYFISTSSAEDLHRRVGGRCTSHNMKIVFKVCCAPEEAPQNTSGASRTPGNVGPTTAVNGGWPGRPAVGPGPGLGPVTSIPTVHQVSSFRPSKGAPDMPPARKPTKKTSEYDKHPNEVVKNEELTYNGSARSPLQRVISLVVVAVIMTCLRWR